MNRFLTLSLALILLTACGRKDVQVGGGDEQKVRVNAPGKELVDPVHGKEEWFAYGPIAGTNGKVANGVIQAHLFEDGTFGHTMQLNIEVAPDGFFYEGWLVGDSPSEMVSTGHLRNHFGDVRHQLKFETEQDLREYKKVVVTLEPDDGDPAPAEHVAEGMLKVTPR